MIIHPVSKVPIVSITRFREDAEYLETMLKSQRISILADSSLADAIQISKCISQGQYIANTPREFAKAAGLSYLAKLAAAVVRQGKLSVVESHLKPILLS
jgi:hypothetical protein